MCALNSRLPPFRWRLFENPNNIFAFNGGLHLFSCWPSNSLFFSKLKMHYLFVGPGSTESVASGASPVSDRPPVLRGFSGSLNGFLGIRPKYGFNWMSLIHLLRSSLTSVPSWYDPLNSFVIQNGPVHWNHNFLGMLHPGLEYQDRFTDAELFFIAPPMAVHECFSSPLLQL